MQKQILIAISILLGSSIAAYAETTTPGNIPTIESTPTPETSSSGTSSEMTKDAWLKTIAPMLPNLICKGFMNDADLKQHFDAIQMDYSQCINVMPQSVDKCQNRLYASIPEKINDSDATIWGKTFGECIGKDFAMRYLIK